MRALGLSLAVGLLVSCLFGFLLWFFSKPPAPQGEFPGKDKVIQL
jgi:hypothetical protein